MSIIGKIKAALGYVRRPVASYTNTYTPTTWEYDVVHGEKVYKDEQLNVLQTNLKTLYELVADLRTQAQIDLLTVQNNLNVRSIKNPTVENVGWLISKCFEAGALIFPAGTMTAVAAGLIARILSGGTQALTRDKTTDSYNAIQSAVNNTHDAMIEAFDQLQSLITNWREDMQSQWLVEYAAPGIDNPSLNKPITLAELATFPGYFPRRGEQTGYDQTRNFVSKQIEYQVTKQLLPVRFKIYEESNGPDSDKYFWSVQWYETSSTSKWNEWRGRKEFPAIPNDLRGDVGGPWEDIGAHRDIKGGTQYWQGYENSGYDCTDEKFSPDHQYWWTRMSGHRWMYWGGRNCSRWDAKEQGTTDNSKIDKDGNIIQGTPFLDFFDDLAYDVHIGYGYYWQNPAQKNALVWYKLSDGSINNRQASRMTCTDYCNDWRYEKNWFKWNWAYRGIRTRIYNIVDQDGHYASDILGQWLFKDDGYGNVTNPHGIANKVDVYHNWGLSNY